MSSIYDIMVQTADGTEKDLADYKGFVLLIVNVASKCGYTPQYEGLEALHRKFRDQGLRILAMPCNDFGGQEPGPIAEVAEFCSLNYGVSFDLFDKVHIKGEPKHPLYHLLTTQATPSGEVQWNFEKFIVGRDGSILQRFASNVEPNDPALVSAIEQALAG